MSVEAKQSSPLREDDIVGERLVLDGETAERKMEKLPNGIAGEARRRLR